MVGIGSDNRTQFPVIQKLVLAVAQLERDFGTAGWLVDRSNLVLALALGDPLDALVGRFTGLAGSQSNFFSNDKRRVEPDTKLPDELGVVFFIAGHRFQKRPRTRFRDGADVIDHLVARHADSVIADGNAALLLVVTDPDLQFDVFLVQAAIGNRAESQAIAGIGSVRDQFA